MAADAARARAGIGMQLAVPGVLAVLTIVGQVLYPLTAGDARDRLTVIVVLLFTAASATHAFATRGSVGLSALVCSAVIGFAVEVIGLHTAIPFGRYDYGDSLGVRVAGVPVVIGLAWAMFAWPAALVARRLVSHPAARVVVGGWALASWDLFLDPQLVASGQWTWRSPTPHLPGVDSVPLTNFAGWLACALVISLALQGFLGTSVADDRWPMVLFLWTYLGSVVALSAFLDLAAAAAWGAIGMGIVAVPLAVSLVRHGSTT